MISQLPSKRRVSSYPGKESASPGKLHTDGFKVMFWGCFSKHAFGPLLALDGTMDSRKYLKVLKNEVLPELEAAQETIGGDWRLMQDKASCHTVCPMKMCVFF
jgi:hypothetical protein